MKFSSLVATAALSTGGLAIGLSFSLSTSKAQTNSPALSQEATLSIQSRCDSLKTNLRQLHTTDALLRVNMGQTYDSLATGLMSRLNSRLVLNRLDGAQMVEITSNFDANHAAFRQAYQDYDDALRQLINTDCEITPELFYERLQLTRQSRQNLNATVGSLNDNIRDYSSAFGRFKKDFLSSEGQS